MANATSTIEEVRFDLRDEQITQVYVLSRAGGDAPIGVQGWHYKAFPARIPMVEILTPQHIGDYLLWPLKAPESHGSYMTINADGDVSPQTMEALAVMGQLVSEQYADKQADAPSVAETPFVGLRAHVDTAFNNLLHAMAIVETMDVDHTIPVLIGIQIANLQKLQNLIKRAEEA